MCRLADELGARAALIPSADKFVSAIARHADALRGCFILSPGIALQSQLADKHSQYELAARHGMPMPATREVSTRGEIAEVAGSFAYPCLMKPGHFREWQRFPPGHPLRGRKIAVAHTRAQLIRTYELVESATPRVIVQEIIEGTDTNKRVYLSCYDAHGRRIANAMFRELRCDPMGFGPATVSEPVEDPEVDEICDRFLRKIGFVGLCEIEMKRDSRDGKPKLIEANPRLSGGGDAAPYAGVDLCWIHYQDLIGRTLTYTAPRVGDFRHIVLRSDASAVPAYWKAGLLGWRDVLRSYRGPRAYFDLDWRDWRYSLETLAISARSFLKAVLAKAPAKDAT
jgi:predicted ATP-grasp superfamily ATP-dependent carboligase